MMSRTALKAGRALALAAFGLLAAAAPALATPVTLNAQPTDADGRITLGELFDGAGPAAEVLVARRTAGTAVLDAAQVQALARRHGLVWANESGIRRIVVRAGADGAAPVTAGSRVAATVEVLAYARSLAAGDIVGPEDVVWTEVQAHQAPSDAPDEVEAVIGLAARRPVRAGAAVRSGDLAAAQVIARNDVIEIEYRSGGVSLVLQGRALETAAVGEAFRVMNTESSRTFEAVAVAPGRAVVGDAALAARAEARGFDVASVR